MFTLLFGADLLLPVQGAAPAVPPVNRLCKVQARVQRQGDDVEDHIAGRHLCAWDRLLTAVPA